MICFVVLTNIATELNQPSEYMNLYVKEHSRTKVLELLGNVAEKTLCKINSYMDEVVKSRMDDFCISSLVPMQYMIAEMAERRIL